MTDDIELDDNLFNFSTEEDEAPKKKRGRPKGSKNVNSGGGTPGRRRGSIAKQIGEQVAALNQFLGSFTFTRHFALTELEAGLFIEGLDKCQQEDPRFRKYVGATGKWGAYATLTAAVAVYSLRVLGDMGFIPKPGEVSLSQGYVCERCSQPAIANVGDRMYCSDHYPQALREAADMFNAPRTPESTNGVVDYTIPSVIVPTA